MSDHRDLSHSGRGRADGGPGEEAGEGWRPDLGPRRSAALLALLLLGTFASRLAFGLHTVLDSDEATTAFTALRITQGHLVLMEANQHYQGALESYILAPFIWLLGPTVIAVIVPLSLVAALYALALYDLGRTVTDRRSAGLLLAAVGSVFPLFLLVWSTKALSGYAETMVLAVVCLSLAARIGWRPGGDRLRNWILLGLVAGVGLWNFVLIAVPLAPIAVALLCRAPTLGWRKAWHGAIGGACGVAVGFSPWIVYNATHGLDSLQNLPSASTSIFHAVKGLVEQELPIFVGTSPECGSTTVTPWVAWIGLGALAAGVVWVRRKPLNRILHGDLGSVGAPEMVLAVAPVALAAVLVGRFNGTPCEPRYLLPMGIPLAFGATLVLFAVRVRWRPLAATLCAAYLFMAALTAYAPTVNSEAATTTSVRIPMNRNQIVTALEARHITALFADYWVARPILYLSGGSISAAVYNGPIAFAFVQADAEASSDAAWLFVDGDPTLATFETLMRTRGVTATETSVDGYELFQNLSSPLRPADLAAVGG
jgi:4-amino-4-deoxy-L-arabinose transferase-like glycosyltransferase